MRVETIGDATLHLGDCREILPTLGRVDAIVTDPPYGLGAKMQGGTWGAKEGFREMLDWDAAPPPDEVIAQLRSLARDVIFWGGQYFSLPPARCWLIWSKTNSVQTMADFEMAWTSLDRPAKRFDAPVGRVEFGHPTQKPLDLMKWCLGFVPDARTILDPFMGSGTTGVACAKMGRRFIGIEIDERYFETACRRIEEAYRQPDMFVPAAPKPQQIDMLAAHPSEAA